MSSPQLSKKFKQIEANPLIPKLLQHIENKLQSFFLSNAFKNITEVHKNEKQYSKAFCVWMNKGQNDFDFQVEGPQVTTFSIDIEVYDLLEEIVIFVIEAKILPTPIASNRAASEYVFSTPPQANAGIKRFRDGNHGLNHKKEYLPESGMLAYIKEHDFEHWHQQVNAWIIAAEWNEIEKLEKISFEIAARLKSKHKRLDESEFTLHHFWVKVE